MQTTEGVQDLKTEASSLEREIAEKTERLNWPKVQLANPNYSDDADAFRELECRDNCVPCIPMPAVKAQIDAEDQLLGRIKELAGAFFDYLFERRISFIPVTNLRERSFECLGKAEAGELIQPCQSDKLPGVSPRSGRTKGCKNTASYKRSVGYKNHV